MNLPPETKWANGTPITGASPAHYMTNETRVGFACALRVDQLTLEWRFRDDRPDVSRVKYRVLVFAACHRAAPTDEKRLRPIATFCLN